MADVAVLIGYEKRPLTEADVAEFCLSLDADVKRQNWLAPAEACEIYLDTVESAQKAHIHAWAKAHALDAVIVPEENRRKKILCADMESTLIKEEMLEEFAARLGLREKVEIITRKAMNGELDFRAALAERLALLKGLSADIVDELVGRMTVMEGARELVSTMRAHGAYCVLVSGGFKAFTEALARQLSFDEEHGNILDIEKGLLTGRLIEPVLDKQSKREILQKTAQAKGLSSSDTCAVGDGANDVPMLLEAGLGVAYHAKPSVEEKASHAIRFASLRALLWAQGYRKHDVSS